MVEFLEASQTLTGVDLATGFTDPVCCRRKENYVLLALVIPFHVVMGKVIVYAMPQRSLAEQDHFRQHFGLHGSDPPFTVGIQIRTPRRQLDCLDSAWGENAIEGGAKLRIPIMQQIPAA